MIVDISKISLENWFPLRLQTNCKNGLLTTIYVCLSIRLSLFTNKTTRLPAKDFHYTYLLKECEENCAFITI